MTADIKNKSSFELLDIPTIVDPRGTLCVLENLLPFKIERTYWIYGADGQTRGGHRHHICRQAAVALSGTIEINMSDGTNQENIHLNRPNKLLLIEPEAWHQMSFSDGAILLVFASHNYDKDDYIFDKYC
jgi:carbamoylphosphate synthase large subunit